MIKIIYWFFVIYLIILTFISFNNKNFEDAFYSLAFLLILLTFKIVKFLRFKVDLDLTRVNAKEQIELSEESISETIRSQEIPVPYHPYLKRENLFTVSEREFYEQLVKIASPRNILVFAKVRIEDIIYVPKYTQNILKWRGFIKSRHIDFVLCDRERIKPLCAIELDDHTHDTEEGSRVDNLKDRIFKAAELPLIRIRVSKSYNLPEIDNKIVGAIVSIAK